MKRIFILVALCMLCLSGCFGELLMEMPSEKYSIGDELELAGVHFNIYKIDDAENELYLLAQTNVATTKFSDSDRPSKYMHDYEGSLVEGYVNRFVDDLEDRGVTIKAYGIIEKEDLYELGFEHSDNMSGLPYRYADDSPEFLRYTDNFWVGGYCKYDTYSWVYSYECLDTEKCENEYGVRPIIVIDASDTNS